MKKTENQILVIFGASGDLTARKLVPALFNLFLAGHLPENFVILGVSRSDMTDGAFRNKVVLESKYLKKRLDGLEENTILKFANKFFYQDLGSDYDTSYDKLRKRVEDLKNK